MWNRKTSLKYALTMLWKTSSLKRKLGGQKYPETEGCKTLRGKEN